ncbi:MAG: carboxypeptidase regulatory-like domain-containing protein [Candidatus Acidiferrales bacterium]|jgi:hypothetical protein
MLGESISKRQVAILLAFGGALLIILIAVIVHYAKPISLRGAVIKQDDDARRQSPITDVEVTVADGLIIAPTKSDFSGYFKLTLPRRVLPGHPVTLQFRHPDYQPLDLKETVSDKLYIVRMVPIHPEADTQPNHAEIAVGNVFVRYSIEATAALNIGTGIKTFQVENTGNVRCNHHPPCSPDAKWKATINSASLDAGNGNQYENARLSCIAGPCPFTKIVSDGFSSGGRVITVSVLGWSDTTTFLLQAEVFRNEISNIVRESYPVIFGESLNFTLPAAAEGPSLEAEINGTNIIFPLGPIPIVSWADCNVRVGKDQSKIYRCELKPGYRFR